MKSMGVLANMNKKFYKTQKSPAFAGLNSDFLGWILSRFRLLNVRFSELHDGIMERFKRVTDNFARRTG